MSYKETSSWEFCFFFMGARELCILPVGGRRGNCVCGTGRLLGQHWCIMLLELLRLLPADKMYGVSFASSAIHVLAVCGVVHKLRTCIRAHMGVYL